MNKTLMKIAEEQAEKRNNAIFEEEKDAKIDLEFDVSIAVRKSFTDYPGKKPLLEIKRKKIAYYELEALVKGIDKMIEPALIGDEVDRIVWEKMEEEGI